jgi:NAD-dependent SIR2 family protein deacetylase
MTTCKECGRELDAEDLVRHELERSVIVHCPGCECLLGRYNRHGDDPKTDLQT